MIRLILALLFAILYLIIGIPVLGVEWIIAKFNKQAADLGQLRMVQWAFRVILFICGTKVTVIGEENVPKDQAVLIHRKPQKLFRYYHHLCTLPASHRLHCEKGYGKSAVAAHLDAASALSVYRP